MSTPRSGTTRELLQLCAGYFVSYIATGVAVKVFTGGIRVPRMSEMVYLVNNTAGSSLLCLIAVLALGWLWPRARMDPAGGGSARPPGRFRVPAEVRWIVPSGVCTAFIIPATTLLYTLPISVMVAMVIMRSSVIIASRVVDAVQVRQGLLRKRVSPDENWAVVFALLALATNLLLVPIAALLESRGIDAARRIGIPAEALHGSFDFVRSPLAMTVLVMYVFAYAVRLYIMNWFKNARAGISTLDNRGFFAWEQLSASLTMALAGLVLLLGPGWFGWRHHALAAFGDSVRHPDAAALASGVPFALVAFFSVFLFMFQGRTATFAGVVNRLTSLIAGTTATLILALVWGLRPPAMQDWVALVFILVAVAFLSRAELKRAAEAKAATG